MTKPRLQRLDRLFSDHPVLFLTACTHNRQRLLANTGIHEAFVSFCQKSSEYKVFVGKYVLIPDHFHLFAYFSEEAHPISDWVKSLKNSLSKQFRKVQIPAPHWQKGFFDHVLRSGESYLEKWGYVANNPVRAQLVSTTVEWPYQGEIHSILPQDL